MCTMQHTCCTHATHMLHKHTLAQHAFIPIFPLQRIHMRNHVHTCYASLYITINPAIMLINNLATPNRSIRGQILIKTDQNRSGPPKPVISTGQNRGFFTFVYKSEKALIFRQQIFRVFQVFPKKIQNFQKNPKNAKNVSKTIFACFR